MSVLEVNTLPIPAYVFQAFNLPVETRNFRQADMVFANNPIINKPYTVPDITKMETQAVVLLQCYLPD